MIEHSSKTGPYTIQLNSSTVTTPYTLDRNLTPSLAGVPFPKNYFLIAKKMLSRLFRVFVHVYIHHFEKIVSIGAVSCML